MNEGLAFDETDAATGALEEPKIPIAGDIDQTLVHSAAAFKVHEDWRRDLIPIPGFVWIVLVVTFNLACSRVHRDC